MSAEFFIHTNVFVHHLDATNRRKHKAAETIVRNPLTIGNACISSLAVQVCLDAAPHKAAVALSPDAVRSCLDVVLAPLMQVTASEALHHPALDVQACWRFIFCDSLVVSGAAAAGRRTLLSEDVQQWRTLDSLVLIDPFR